MQIHCYSTLGILGFEFSAGHATIFVFVRNNALELQIWQKLVKFEENCYYCVSLQSKIDKVTQ